ncbi:glycine cleavage system aminomethyltransferase GcvT [Ruficoccus amylovorans]|uniref:aminomethyltransferase n=1 Tax=Ruficoccus amylovorans TaxID=1804625 RepID=A0A842HGK3_9BACT|nr:glycine cleavage system aminomethyltransferase GcvT [Ruficoccus amylovorans]MBC2594756.1 glycine cleavage system aminomethyltransferase GcvT [Ruficoccus amylovorans]
MSDLKQTPLIDFHKQLGARCVPFAGWEMPVSYAGIIEEHMAVRERCGFFDVCHMGEFVVSGPQAEQFLDHALTNHIAGTPAGKAVYSPLCAANGATIDDLIVYRRGAEDFLVVVNASNIDKDFAHFQAQAEGYEVKLENISDAVGLIAVQGPRAVELVQSLAPDTTLPKRFRHAAVTLGGLECRLSRTGYTGEDGFEVFCAAGDTLALAKLLTAAGEPFGAQWCGLGARDSLRLEAGFPLYGHELSETITPIIAGLGWAVKLDKPHFTGREALGEQAMDANLPRVRFFTLEGRRIAREGTEVLDAENKVVGKVLSGTLSPVRNQPIGSALLSDESELPLRVELRGHTAEMTLLEPPLHK